MGKNFKVIDWVKTVKSISRNHPEIRLFTSIIVGFPSEEEADFNKSLNLINNTLFDRVDVYMYDERPGLPSLRLKGRVSEETKRKRYNKMRSYAALNNLRKRISRRQILY
jgi:tRNA A37 methylthiotransferase MiaB